MKMKPTQKDFYMEIRKSPGRFLSILFIVALGVAFFSGIRSSEPSMRATGDYYFDSNNLMDIKALSTYGITEDDITAIGNVDGVEKVEGAYSTDVLTVEENNQRVLHIMTVPQGMNQVSVSEGRLPDKAGECLVDDEMDYKIGDEIVVESGTEDAVTDTLQTDTLKVVGIGSSPCYISFTRGSTTIGSGSIDGFVVVSDKTFDMEVYSEAYVQVEGAKDLVAYTDTYNDTVENVLDGIEDITDVRAEARRDEITEDAKEELADGRAEYEEEKAKALKELDDAAAEIADGEVALNDAKNQVSSGQSQLASAKNTLTSKEKELSDAKDQYQSGMKQYNDGKAQYDANLAAYEAQKPEAEAEIAKAKEGLAQLQTAVAGQQQQIGELQGQIDTLNAEKAELDPVADAEQIAELQGQIDSLTGSKNQLEQTVAEEQEQIVGINAQIQAGEARLTQAESQLASAKATLDASLSQLTSAKAQIDSGQSQISAGWAELKKQEQTLASAQNEIAENEAKLADAKVQYEDGKKEADEKLADAEQELIDAEAEIEDIKLPTWYVYDRSTLPEYDGYGENADRMKAIGQVFPVLFFLVAALISLTSMTRMVEEQRIQIGTMKALGYGKVKIASKYLGYALIATVLGSVMGFLIGEKVLPYIIIYAYGIMYHHIYEIIVPYNWYYAGMATGAAVFCTMFATCMSCYNELRAKPAVLMRPPAPKKGQRVFLERLTFIWRRLNFSWKSTIRNLMRYKKRFFMTVFGISGCMALMIVGFGLRDSIFEIADIQYAEIELYDGTILLQEDVSEEEKDELDTYLDDNKQVDWYMDCNVKSVTLTNGKEERDTYEYVIENVDELDGYLQFRDRLSREEYELTDDGVLISEKTATLLDVEEGDTLEIKDETNGNKEVVISHIFENYMGHSMYMTKDYYEKVYGEDFEANCMLFAAPEEATNEEVENIGQKILSQEQVLNVSYMHEIRKQLDDMLKSLNLVIVVLIVSAGMLAFVVLYNLNNINIAERQRELATLKVLGFYDPEVALYVYRENIMLTFIGAFVGVALGKVLHLFIIRTVEVDAVMFGRNVYLPSYVYSLLFTIAFSMLVNLVMYWKLKKIDMVESLKSIE